ncbi:MAG: hypothetical protein QW667_06660 [Candidatus Bathyarchaeia archaeon]
MNTKQTAFIAMMSSLGTILSGISLHAAIITIVIPGQAGAALDLSHIATFIAAVFGGPYVGAAVGFLSGIYAGYYFGYVIGNLGVLSLLMVPLGKALTGLTAGFLYKKLRISECSKPSILTIPIILVSYVPECLFTTAYFLYIIPVVYGFSMSFMIPIVIPKAWVEIAIMSVLMGILAGNLGFKEFVLGLLQPPKLQKIATKE